ncbi:HTH domain-containing protein [Rothia dentocariosa]|uniref:HTH domain protein n=1 Tax=Rothia dentocariosa (strain ATCC 17931 / CDC X599 / XDIA) TaxID=762948 RepID=E3H2B5_ROTDC|nr:MULTISPECIES: helix-turn-helix domain-containing protein [Rothia]ADP41348.1 HTH domain protein [Rothia dentocariosa ATCC 17931]MCM3437384.1 MarR family transcriptional regulator [Rothia dentocariosa]NLR25394.1 HTH domain-containing protein [Rothia dentocariosa]OFQ06112.1 ArsR family transcriptional regulator [Rothia sp. HMSC036D11]TFI38752.1 HTH domain-containing protein [Rothia dentocariosa]
MYSVNKTSHRGLQQQPSSHKKSSSGARKAEVEERTRDRVLRGVLNHGPVSAASLGELLSLTPAAVRRHLDALEQANMIEVASLKQYGAGAGRPARRYVIAPQGHERLGNDYLMIARNALEMLRDTVGESALETFASARAAEMEARYRPVVEAAGEDVAARAQALAEAMSRDGFVTTAQITEPPAGRLAPGKLLASIQLCQGHCPIRDLAEDFQVFCEQETGIISDLLGVDVRRLSTMAGGAHVCTTHVPLNHLTERVNSEKPETSESMRGNSAR